MSLSRAKQIHQDYFLNGNHFDEVKLGETHQGHGTRSCNTGFFRLAQDIIFEIELYNRLRKDGDSYHSNMEADLYDNIVWFYNRLEVTRTNGVDESNCDPDDDPRTMFEAAGLGPDTGYSLLCLSKAIAKVDHLFSYSELSDFETMCHYIADSINNTHGKWEADGVDWENPTASTDVGTNCFKPVKAVNTAATMAMGLGGFSYYTGNEPHRTAMVDFAKFVHYSNNKDADGTWLYGGGGSTRLHNHTGYNAWCAMGLVYVARATIYGQDGYNGEPVGSPSGSLFFDSVENAVDAYYSLGSDVKAVYDKCGFNSVVVSTERPAWNLGLAAASTSKAHSLFNGNLAASNPESLSTVNDPNDTSSNFHRMIEGFAASY